VVHEKFYNDVHHDSLRPTVPKDPRASHAGSSAAPATATSRTTHGGGAPFAPVPNSSILKMLQGIFDTCRRTDHHLDVMDQCLQIVWRNQGITYSQWDEPLQEFPDIPDPYCSLTLAMLTAFSIGPAHVSFDNDDEEQADDNEEMEDDK
jgi:hypothetical protein